jgi:hypothetical protein
VNSLPAKASSRSWRSRSSGELRESEGFGKDIKEWVEVNSLGLGKLHCSWNNWFGLSLALFIAQQLSIIGDRALNIKKKAITR